MAEVAAHPKAPTPPSQGAPRREKALALNEGKCVNILYFYHLITNEVHLLYVSVIADN